MKNYYEILGIEQNASTEEITKKLIERAYNCTPEEIELYKEISTVLCSQDRRKDYDQSLQEYSISVEENIPQPVYGPPKREEYEVVVMENIPQPVYGPPKREEYEVVVMENIPQPVYGPPKREEIEMMLADKPQNTPTSSNNKK